MFAFLDSFWKRTYKYYNFSGLFFVSLILALFAVILQQIMNSSFVTIVVLLSCILNSTKETDAYLNLNKFKSFYFTDEHVLKLSLFLYVKRNKFFWIGLLYSVFCLVNTSLFIENISVIMIGLCSLYSNLSLNKWSERIGEFHLVVLIILSTFHLGYYFSVAMNGLFCSALFILLIPENKGGIGKKKIRDRVISAKVPLLIRHLMLEQWQVNACLMFFFYCS